MRDNDFYALCKDTRNSHITSCTEYNQPGCPKVCKFAKEQEARQKESALVNVGEGK